jgi:beta-glucosidase-like glycosyl hydrolase
VADRFHITSYNRINQTFGCENSYMMNGILKGELG